MNTMETKQCEETTKVYLLASIGLSTMTSMGAVLFYYIFLSLAKEHIGTQKKTSKAEKKGLPHIRTKRGLIAKTRLLTSCA